MEIKQLLRYNAWATGKICDQLETLPQEFFEKPLGGSFGSIKATVVHLIEAEWIWLSRFKGMALPEFPDWRNSDMNALNTKRRELQDDTLLITSRFSNDPGQKIEFNTRAGIPYSVSFEAIILHITHHGSYHRGQLAYMIRQAGEKPVSTDYFIFSTTE